MNNPIQRAGEAMPDDSVCTQVEGLANQLAELLPHWANGQYMAMIHPRGDSRGIWFRNVNSPSGARIKILQIEEELETARNWNEALFMAAGSIDGREQMNAVQSVADAVSKKLALISERLDELRGDLA